MRNAFLVAVASSIGLSASLMMADALDLNNFLNQDLRKADSNHVANLIHFLDAKGTNDHSERQMFSTRPWFVWKCDTQSIMGRFIVFEGQPIFMIPGTSSAAVHVFDQAATQLSSCKFSTGWRMDLKAASLVEQPALRTEVVELCTEPTRQHQNIPRLQIYGFVGSRLALIRLEGSRGEIFRNTFIYPNQTIGPSPPTRTPDQWEAALKSDDYVEMLEALMWLGGRHLDASDDFSMKMVRDVVHEDFNEAKIFTTVWNRKSVQRVLDLLVESKIKWVSEAAALAKIKDATT